MANLEEIHIKDLPITTNLIWIDESRPEGKRAWCICPYCKTERLVYKWHITNGNWSTTACSRHRNLPKTKWAIKGEFDGKKNVIVDYTNQKLATVGQKRRSGNPYQTVHIMATCPDCKQDRWVLVNGIRNNGLSTLCPTCAARRHALRGALNPCWQGGIQITNGYREVHKLTIPPDFLPIVEQFMGASHRNYYYEHRLVALKHFGPESVAPGMVVRHLDGDKLNNLPSNLAYGPQSANIRDHVEDRRDLKAANRYINLLKSELEKHGITAPSS